MDNPQPVTPPAQPATSQPASPVAPPAPAQPVAVNMQAGQDNHSGGGKKMIIAVLVIVLILAVLAAGGYYFYSQYMGGQTTTSSESQPAPQAVASPNPTTQALTGLQNDLTASPEANLDNDFSAIDQDLQNL